MKSSDNSSKRFRFQDKEVWFDYDVKFPYDMDDYYIVHLNNRDSKNINDQPSNNIYAVDYDANILWNIQEIVGDNPYFGAIYFLPSYEEKTYLVAVDCLGYHHKIDLKSRKLIDVKYIRMGNTEGKSCIGITQIEEVDDYFIVCTDNFCRGEIFDNIYAVDRDFNPLWNIREIVHEYTICGGFYVISPIPGIRYIVAVSYGCRYTIDLTTKKFINKECSK